MGHRVSRITMTSNQIYLAAAVAFIAAATSSTTIEARNNYAQHTCAPFPSSAVITFDQRGCSRVVEGELREINSGTAPTCYGGPVQTLTRNKIHVENVRQSTFKYPVSSTTASSSSWPCCFVGASSPPPSPLFHAQSRLKCAKQSRTNLVRPFSLSYSSKCKRRQPISPLELGAHKKSSLSVESRSSSRWEPLRIREYNQNARRNKRRDHLLKVVRGSRFSTLSHLQFTDDRNANEAVNVTWDMKQVHHWKTHAQRSLFFLRKDKHGKIRTRWHDKEEVESDSSLACLPSRMHKTANQTETSMALPIKIPRPTVRSSEAEGYAATDVSTLRKIFGTNRNKLWGDLDAETARILYHTLLPRALIRLHSQGLAPDELAPLAYEARVAAKKYARERCQVPARVLAVVYDGIRHLRKYGKWSSDGLSWDQIWEKYEKQIQEEIQHTNPSLKLQELTSQVCLRILDRSCRTNELVDRIVMSGGNKKEALKNGRKKSVIALEVLAIANKFDREIHELLERKEGQSLSRAREFFLMRIFVQTRKTASSSNTDDSARSLNDKDFSFSFEL